MLGFISALIDIISGALTGLVSAVTGSIKG